MYFIGLTPSIWFNLQVLTPIVDARDGAMRSLLCQENGQSLWLNSGLHILSLYYS